MDVATFEIAVDVPLSTIVTVEVVPAGSPSTSIASVPVAEDEVPDFTFHAAQ